MNFIQSSQVPLLHLQLPSNKQEVSACTNCGCTNVHTQLRHLATTYNISTNATTQPIYCPLGCGAKYCTISCRDRHLAMGHRYLCVGPHDEDHPLYKFVLLALETGGAFEELILASQIVIGSLIGTNASSTTSSSFLNDDDRLRISQMVALWQDAMHKDDEILPPWWTLVSSDLSNEEKIEWEESAKLTVDDAWEYLSRGLTHSTKSKHDNVLASYNSVHFAKLLTLITKEKRNVMVTTMLEEKLNTLHNNGGIDNDLQKGFWTAIMILAREKAKVKVEEEQFERDFENELGYSDDEEYDEEYEKNEGTEGTKGTEKNSNQNQSSSYDTFLTLSSSINSLPSEPSTTVTNPFSTKESLSTNDSSSSSSTATESFTEASTRASTKTSTETSTEASTRIKNMQHAYNMILAEPCKYLAEKLQLVVLPPLEYWERQHSCIPDQLLTIEKGSTSDVVSNVGHTASHTASHTTSHTDHANSGCIVVKVGPVPSTKTTLDLDQNTEDDVDEDNEEKEDRDQVTVVVGGSGTISRIETYDLTLEERTEALELRGIRCTCLRCVHERSIAECVEKHQKNNLENEFDQNQVIEIITKTKTKHLRTLARIAASEGRYGDAKICLKELITRKPNDGNLLLALSRLEGWSDQWTTSRNMLFNECAVKFPNHKRISEKIKEARRYDPSISTSSTLTTSTSSKTSSKTSSETSSETIRKFCGNAFVATNVLDVQLCRDIISNVESHIQEIGGWTTSRHYAVPTTDVPVHEIKNVLISYNQLMKNQIAPMLSQQYSVAAASIRTIDAFVVKYDASKQRSLPLHCDQSQFSLTIALNSLSEYDGGGTYFAEYGQVLNCDVGGVISFQGSLFHGGHPITSGTRYILVAFLYSHIEAE